MKIHLFLIVLLLLAHCNSGNNENASKETADSDKVIVDISKTIDVPVQLIDEYIDSIKIIPLETTESSIVSFIWSVKVGEKNMFIQDSYTKGNVAQFDLDGHFVKRLPFGQGPGEIIYATKIKYNGVNNHLYIFDSPQSKIFKYDESGNYVNNYPTMNFIVDFIPTHNGILTIQDPTQNPDNEYCVYLNDTLAENIKTWPLGTGFNNGAMPDNMYQIGEDFRFQKNVDNIIYSYHNQQIKETYEIKYDNPPIDYSKFEDIRDIMKEYPDAYFLSNGILETKNWLRMDLNSQSKMRKSIFVNKKTFKSWSQDINCLPEYFTSWMNIIGADAEKDIFIGIVEPERLLKAKPFMEYGWDGSNPNNLISPEDMEKLKKVQPDDNPIIVLFKLKDEI